MKNKKEDNKNKQKVKSTGKRTNIKQTKDQNLFISLLMYLFAVEF